MKFGAKLKQARQRSELTQEQVIKKLGVTRQSLSNWENDRSYPDLASAVRLSDLYQVPLDDLLRDDMELRRQMELQRNQRKTRIFVLYDLSLLLLASSVPLNWLDKPGLGFILSGLGLLLCFLSHYLIVRFLGVDWRLMAIRSLSMTFLWAGIFLWAGKRHIGILLFLLGDILEIYLTRRLQLIEKEFRHMNFFTGVVMTLVIVFCFVPFGGDAARRGDFVEHNPFTGHQYRVAEVIRGSDGNIPLIRMPDNKLVYLDYPGEETIHLNGEFTYINQPQGSDTLGVWELFDSGVLYRITVEADGSITFAALENDAVQWKYKLEYAPTAGITITDLLSTATGSINWNYSGSFDSNAELTGYSLSGKGKIMLSVPGEEPTVTIYEEYRDGDSVEYNTLILTRDKRGRVEFTRNTRPDEGKQTGIYRIPYENGEFIFVINYM